MGATPPQDFSNDAAPGATPGPWLSGAVIGERYVIEKEIGRGSTSIVYLARDTRDERMLAIKTLRPELAQSVSATSFVREIDVTRKLDHPAIVSVLGSGEHEGVLYFILPYAKDGTLRDRLERERQLPLADALAIGATLADALDYAHAHNLMHRDIKPENILFGDNGAAIADFGIAKAIERAAGESTTITGLVRGTPAYMSPEQAGGDNMFDGRSDIYSLGCVVYEMIAGVQAFVGPTAQSVLAQRMLHAPRPLEVYRPTTPHAITDAVNRALATAPADRYQKASLFASALRSAATAPPRSGRRRKVLLLVAAALIAIVGTAVAFVVPGRRNELSAREALVRGDLYAERFRTPDQMRNAIAAYEEAARLDPNLSIAFARLSQVESYMYADYDHTDGRKKSAKAALDNALQLAPALPDTRLALGFYKYWVEGERDSAMVYLTAANEFQESNPALIGAAATMLRSRAQWDAALALSRRAAALEPQSPRWATDVGSTELWMNRYADADRDFQRAIQLRPDNVAPYLERVYVQMLWKGDTAAVRAVLAEAEARIPRLEILKAFVPRFRFCLAMFPPDWQKELDRRSQSELGVTAGAYHLAKMERYQRAGQRDRARAYADSAVADFEPAVHADPRDEYLHGELAFAYAGQGRRTEARREGEEAMRLALSRDDATVRGFRSANLTLLYIATGDGDRAIAQLAKENRSATYFSRQLLANHPDFASLRSRPDFQALLPTFK